LQDRDTNWQAMPFAAGVSLSVKERHRPPLLLARFPGKDWAYGGYVASQVQIADYPARNFAELSAEGHFRLPAANEAGPLEGISHAARDSTGDAAMPQVIAYGMEFVALPGTSEKLRTVIPDALHTALGGTENFSGCMILVSEQETRLVTVITLWAGTDRAKRCDENSKRVEGVLSPYVDRWLRTQRLAAFLSMP
jgi:hypothetical protein